MNTHYSTSTSQKKKSRMSLASARVDQSMPSYQNQTVQQTVIQLPQRDDLFIFEGVDPVIEMALNSIGIRRFSDFEGYTPQSLSQALQNRAGISISPNTIADWIGWAAIFAAADTDQMTLTVEGEGQKQASIENAYAPDDEHHTASSEEESEMKDGALQIKEIRFVQVEMPATADTPSKQLLQGEMCCELAGRKTFAKMDDRIPLCAQIHAIDLATGESTLLASQAEYSQPDLIDYNVRLQFELPKEGRYQLQAVVFWLDADSSIDFYQGPTLRVIP